MVMMSFLNRHGYIFVLILFVSLCESLGDIIEKIELHHSSENELHYNENELRRLMDYDSNILKKYDIDKNDNTEEHLSISRAIIHGNFLMVQHLRRYKQNYLDRDNHGRIAMHYACFKDDRNAVNELKKWRWSDKWFGKSQFDYVDNDGMFPADYAIIEGHHDLFMYLFSKRAMINPLNSNNQRTTLHLACLGGNVDLISWFLSWSGETYVSLIKRSRYRTVNFDPSIFLKRSFGFKVGRKEIMNNLDSENHSPLDLACLKGHLGAIQLFFEKGFLNYLKSDIKHRLLKYAILSCKQELVKYLMQQFWMKTNELIDVWNSIHSLIHEIKRKVSEYCCLRDAKSDNRKSSDMSDERSEEIIALYQSVKNLERAKGALKKRQEDYIKSTKKQRNLFENNQGLDEKSNLLKKNQGLDEKSNLLKKNQGLDEKLNLFKKNHGLEAKSNSNTRENNIEKLIKTLVADDQDDNTPITESDLLIDDNLHKYIEDKIKEKTDKIRNIKSENQGFEIDEINERRTKLNELEREIKNLGQQDLKMKITGKNCEDMLSMGNFVIDLILEINASHPSGCIIS